MARQYFASDFAYGINPEAPPITAVSGPNATGAGTLILASSFVTIRDVTGSHSFQPLATNAPILAGVGSVAETVTPSAVSNTVPSVTATFSNAHGSGTLVASGTVGLQEALNLAAAQNGGAVIVDGRWAQLGGTTGLITAAANPTGSGVFILDYRGSVPALYTWNGSAFASAGTVSWPAGANGQTFATFVNTELVTLNTGGATTDSAANLLPANSIILAVNGTVQTTITTATNWQLGDASTAGRFSAVDSTLTAGESVPKTSFPPVQIGTGVASATAGVYQAAAAKVRITTTGSNPGAGKIRLTVYGFTLVNATS